MNKVMTGILVIAFIVVIVFVGSYGSWAMYNYFAPKYAATQNTIFHHGPEYNHGMEEQLRGLESRYIVATPTQKAALRSVIIDEFAAYHGPLTPSLKSFYQKIEEENNE